MTGAWFRAIAASLLLSSAGTSSFADDHAHAATHGGQFVEAEGHHGVELVVSANALTFYLTDEGKPMDLTGAQFKAIVQTEAGTTMVPLVADGGALKGTLAAPLPSGAKVAISGKDRHGHALQARIVTK